MGQGRNNVKGYLREQPEVAAEIERKIYEAVGAEPATAPLTAVPPPEEAETEPPADPAPAEEQAA
jgi:hypothetical protein